MSWYVPNLDLRCCLDAPNLASLDELVVGAAIFESLDLAEFLRVVVPEGDDIKVYKYVQWWSAGRGRQIQGSNLYRQGSSRRVRGASRGMKDRGRAWKTQDQPAVFVN